MNSNMKNQIGNALRESTIAYGKNGELVQPVVTQEYDLVSQVKFVEEMIVKVTRSSEVMFSVKTRKVLKSKFIQETKLGKLFMIGLGSSIYEIRQHYPLHQFNPYFNLFVQHVEDRHLYEILPWINRPINDDDVYKWCDVLNGCVDSIRKEANSAAFKKTINDYHRVANKNYRELIRYINAQFDQCARQLVLRLDLGYMKAQLWPNGVETPMQYEEVKKHWEAMLRYLSKKLPNDCLNGFAWKLEYGLEKSFHYHVLIFLDGSKVREDVTIARLIGEQWANIITGGKGLYYNCNAFKDGYKSCGIGMVAHDNIAAREGLEKAAFYMCKTDYYIKMVAPGNGRTFGKGNMPQPRTSNRGRPRATTKASKPMSGVTLGNNQIPAS